MLYIQEGHKSYFTLKLYYNYCLCIYTRPHKLNSLNTYPVLIKVLLTYFLRQFKYNIAGIRWEYLNRDISGKEPVDIARKINHCLMLDYTHALDLNKIPASKMRMWYLNLPVPVDTLSSRRAKFSLCSSGECHSLII